MPNQLEKFDKALNELQSFLKSDTDSVVTEEEIATLLKSEISEEEKQKAILDMLKANGKFKKAETEDEDEDEDEEEDEEEEDEETTEKSLETIENDYEEYIDGVPFLETLAKSVKYLVKQHKKDKALIKSMGSFIATQGELLKSFNEKLDLIGKTPGNLKGIYGELQKSNSGIIERNYTTPDNQLKEDVKFLMNPVEVEKRLSKAIDEKRIEAHVFRQEESCGFRGAYITQRPDYIEILKSYEGVK